MRAGEQQEGSTVAGLFAGFPWETELLRGAGAMAYQGWPSKWGGAMVMWSGRMERIWGTRAGQTCMAGEETKKEGLGVNVRVMRPCKGHVGTSRVMLGQGKAW